MKRCLILHSRTPPSLYKPIVGDAFAPRSQYAMTIDFEENVPRFEINGTHWAKTWLLHPDAPKVQKPEVIRNLHDKISSKQIYREEGNV